MNKLLVLLFVFQIQFLLKAQNSSAEYMAKNCVTTYYSLLDNYSNNPYSSDKESQIYRIFRDGDGKEPVYIDVYDLAGGQNSGHGSISDYLAAIGALRTRNGISLSFSTDPNSYIYKVVNNPKYARQGGGVSVFVSASKHVHAGNGVEFTTYEVFDIEDNKITCIQQKSESTISFLSAIDYYEKGEYKQAFQLFTQEAVEQHNYISAYWLAIMLLKKQGCSYPEKVRMSMALFWLYKSSKDFQKSGDLLEILNVGNYPRVTTSSPVENGLLSDINKKGQYGFIDLEGNVKIGYKFSGSGSFSNGLAAVKQNYKWGYIDYQGKQVIDFMFDEAEDFQSDGTAFVVLSGRRIKINKQGKRAKL